MSSLAQISHCIEERLAAYRSFVTDNMKDDGGEVTMILNYILSTRGKGIRPLLVLLCGGMHDPLWTKSERVYLSAMIIEMIHTTSLVHDDVVDEAFLRRGAASVNALWGNKNAILTGDYLLAKSYMCGMRSGHYDLVSMLTSVMENICRSELLQNKQSDSLTMTRDIYNSIIYGKTATLIGICCAMGAQSVGASAQQVASMKAMGDMLGMAFQIKDDILDFTTDSQTGKLACNDLRERKITLPLLLVLEECTSAERRELISRLSDIRRHPENADFIVNSIKSHNGLEKATGIMEDYITKAKNMLGNYPVSEYKESLLELFDFIGERGK